MASRVNSLTVQCTNSGRLNPVTSKVTHCDSDNISSTKQCGKSKNAVQCKAVVNSYHTECQAKSSITTQSRKKTRGIILVHIC